MDESPDIQEFLERETELPKTEASFTGGRCGICDETIYEGDLIIYIDGEWCHQDCEE